MNRIFPTKGEWLEFWREFKRYYSSEEIAKRLDKYAEELRKRHG